MYGYIYLTINTVNDKKYIGQHRSDKYDKGYLGSGILINKAIRKYGRRSFEVEIIESCDSNEDLGLAEIFHIWQNKAVESDEFYNLSHGGNGCCKQTEEVKRKISNANSGLKRSDEMKEKVSKANAGNTHTEKTKEIIRQKRKNQIITKESRIKASKKMKGRKHSEEAKAKMKLAAKNRVYQMKTCPHCNKTGVSYIMTRCHFDNCKQKIL